MLPTDKHVKLDTVQVAGDQFYRISNVDELRPFFMSIVSDSNHWMFISSNGGVTAGRKNAEHALFPYYTDDKITEFAEFTGSKSVFQVQYENGIVVWEPFSERFEGKFELVRNLYKSTFGNKILFEEINRDLGLIFQYAWNFSNTFGFVKKSRLTNTSDDVVKINLLDGIQNIVPAGLGSDLQNRVSNLADAYKRSELDKVSGLGMFALSANIVDKAEPSEALKANVAFSIGLQQPGYLLSSLQLKQFRKGQNLVQEEDVKGEKGAYFVFDTLSLSPNEDKEWMIVANVNQNHSGVISLLESIKHDQDLGTRIQQDIDLGTENLVKLVAAADGLQHSGDPREDTRHYANVLFNIMRGGIFDDNYQIERADFRDYLEKANSRVFAESEKVLQLLAEKFSLFDLRSTLSSTQDPDFIRLATEYLPLKFSRRHGDPSRPWNRFSINSYSEIDGSKILDYEGNWRDIFQNWEALAHAYPAFIEGMIFKFLNASTFDGYNPYRVTKGGYDWEIIEPDDPWSYIGYWGDHQIIYLLKFLECAQKHYPDLLGQLLDKACFVYAQVPYRIKSYQEILQNPKDTIDFDFAWDEKIREERQELGADGALFKNKKGDIIHVNLVEKLLATVLSKLSNFILEGGIWMNTQRPEWNDANNALVGNGVSMVTLNYLRRFLKFFSALMQAGATEQVMVSAELAGFYDALFGALQDNKSLLQGHISDTDRKRLLDLFGEAASHYRSGIYDQSFSGNKKGITLEDLNRFSELSIAYIEHAITANQRKDKLYHGYNLMAVEHDAVPVSHLSEMLEGQVAVLSSGFLTVENSVSVLDALKSSKLFREDQYSYLLYPNKDLPGFLQKNTMPKEMLEKNSIFKKGTVESLTTVLEKDVLGNYHFNGNFHNAADLEAALSDADNIDAQGKAELLQIFEALFNHKAFTGRSGTFFGYEGLGSIYWHMVSKLRLAVLETCLKAIESKADKALVGRMLEHYFEITAGIGVHKSPELYGAFPTDPYSHTPMGKGAQQPGMTGQVKEDILCRFGELGVVVREGQVHFQPVLLRKDTFLKTPAVVYFYNVQGEKQQLALPENALCFTYCQVPVVYVVGAETGLEVHFENGDSQRSKETKLSAAETQEILHRTAAIRRLTVFINPDQLL